MKTFAATLDLTASVTRVMSYFVSETAGAAAVVNLRNGSATGSIFQQIRIPATVGGADKGREFTKPLLFPSGLYVEVVAGTVVGAIQSG